MDLKFRQDLAEWAIHEYGNIQEAAKVLGRKVPTLYQDRRGGK
jgi:hypothetical protein